MLDPLHYQQLLEYLDEAEKLSKEFTGGYSNQFLSAEEFHSALAKSITALKAGDKTQLGKLYIWFAPTCCWDDFIGMNGQDLANKVFELVCILRTSNPSSKS